MTINGVACGDILTHNVSEFVKVTGNQTIGGVKTWTAQQKYAGNNTRGVLSVYNSSYTKGSAVSVTDLSIGTIFMGDGGNTGLTNSLGFISCDLADTGNRSMLSISAIKNEASSGARANLIIEYDKSDTTSPERIRCKGEVLPNSNNFYSLGTSTNKWKSFNGVNPGALSLPNTASPIQLDTTSFDVTATTIGTFASTVDGWAILSMSQKNKPFGIWIISGFYRASFYSVKNNTDYMIFALIPVKANLNMTIYCTADDIDSTRVINWLRVYPCQGNV